MAFGTGLHPTTQMCLAALEELIRPKADVLDLGTGSGILAIAAAKLGAGHVLAVDNDPVAVRTARGNVVANGVQATTDVMCGSLPEVPGTYDLVMVNILAKVIIEFCGQGLGALPWPGGFVIASGIIEEQAEAVSAALEAAGLAVVGQRRLADWVALICRRTSA